MRTLVLLLALHSVLGIETLWDFGAENWLLYQEDRLPPEVSGRTWYDDLYEDASADWRVSRCKCGFGDGNSRSPFVSTRTNYLRRHITMTADRRYHQARLEGRIDDGFALFFNGQLVDRVNLRDGALSHTLKAKVNIHDHAEGNIETVFIPNELWRVGDNVLAVSVHNVEPNNKDSSFNARMRTLLVPSESATRSPPPSASSSPAPTLQPSAPPSASPAPSPSRTPSAASADGSPGPSAGASPATTASRSAAPSASSSGAGGGDNGGSGAQDNDGQPSNNEQQCTTCSCACVTACHANDPILNDCGSKSTSNTTTVVLAVGGVLVFAVVGALAAMHFRDKSKRDADGESSDDDDDDDDDDNEDDEEAGQGGNNQAAAGDEETGNPPARSSTAAAAAAVPPPAQPTYKPRPHDQRDRRRRDDRERRYREDRDRDRRPRDDRERRHRDDREHDRRPRDDRERDRRPRDDRNRHPRDYRREGESRPGRSQSRSRRDGVRHRSRSRHHHGESASGRRGEAVPPPPVPV